MTRFRSLRWRLAALGLVAAVIPLAVLVAVVFSVETDTNIQSADQSTVEVNDTVGVSPWVPLAAALLTVPAAGMAWWWSDRAVRPVLDITNVANEIQGTTLDRRIGLAGAPVEVQALADSFDAMLDRLASASTVQRRLIEETSHELRTPLTALRVNADIILDQPHPSIDDYEASAQRTKDLVERLQATVESQLASARTHNLAAGQLDNDLMAIVSEVIYEMRTVHPDVTIDLDGPTTLALPIDPTGVERAIRNLVDNAVRVSPPDRPVEVTVAADRNNVELSISDEGPGINPADQERIFDRYYSTNPDPGTGHGIGLALVKQVADTHGRINVESPPPGRTTGTRFTLILNRTN